MEFRTTQGGESTLVFDEGERLQLEDLAKRQKMHFGDVTALLQKQRQADPLADFDQLLAKTFPQMFALAGVVPQGKKSAKVDPTIQLEEHIRRRLASTTTGPGVTSQSQQVEATLLAALATCLQTQALLRLAEKD